MERRAVAGEKVSFNAAGTSDPDGDSLAYDWWHYCEPGTYTGTLRLHSTDAGEVSFVAPAVPEPQTIHLILAVTDRGEPRLTSYHRVIVTVIPPVGTSIPTVKELTGKQPPPAPTPRPALPK